MYSSTPCLILFVAHLFYHYFVRSLQSRMIVRSLLAHLIFQFSSFKLDLIMVFFSFILQLFIFQNLLHSNYMQAVIIQLNLEVNDDFKYILHLHVLFSHHSCSFAHVLFEVLMVGFNALRQRRRGEWRDWHYFYFIHHY